MKKLKNRLGCALCILLACVLVSCDSMSVRTCHLAAKEYAQQKGYDIDTAMCDGYHSVILTKDSTVIWVNSNGYKYPYVKEFTVVRTYAR